MKYIEFTDKQIKENNRRAMKNGLFSNLNKEQLNELISKYFRDENGDLHCAYTGEVIKNKKDLALEHIIPVNRNGSSVIFNVCPALTGINMSKHDNDLLTWWQDQDFYDIDRLRNLTMYMLEAYELFFNERDSVLTMDAQDTTEDVEKLKQEGYSKPKRITEKQLEQIDYRSFLKMLIDELRENEITLVNIDKDNKYEIDYRELYNQMLSNNYFEDFKEIEKYQKIIFKYLKTYAKDRKYAIAANINYKDIYKNLEQMLKKEDIKEEDKITRIDYLIHSRITFLRNTITVKLNSTEATVLETIIDMPELLYQPISEFTDEYIEQIKDNLPMNKYIKMQYLLDFYSVKQRWPKNKEKYKGVNIGSFLTNIRIGDTKISEEQKKNLLELDANALKNPQKTGVDYKFDLLLNFYKKYGRWPKDKEQYQGENIGSFLSRIRTETTKISEKQKQQLLELDANVFENQKKRRANLTFDSLIEFYQKNGRWPTQKEQYKGENLGSFLSRIRAETTKISETQKQQLLELDANVFENQKKRRVNLTFDSLIEFYQKNGRWPTQKEQYKGENLGSFLGSIRAETTKISETQKQQLLELDANVFENQPKIMVNRKFDLLIEFYQENGRWPKDKEQYQGENIGSFLGRIRTETTKISETQKQQLLELDANVLKNPQRAEINRKIDLLIEFYQENERWPKNSEQYRGENVGSFLSRIRTESINISEEQKQQLLELDANVLKNPQRAEINRKFDLLIEFYQENGRWPKAGGEIYQGENIGGYLRNIRVGDTTLSEKQRNQLLFLDPTLVFSERRKRIKEVKKIDNNLIVEEEVHFKKHTA